MTRGCRRAPGLPDLARLMNGRPRDVNRLAALRHPTRIDKIAQAFRAPGKRLELPVRYDMDRSTLLGRGGSIFLCA